jgi:MFS family permease
MPTLPIFAVSVVKLQESEVGIVVGAFSVTALVLRPFIGYAIDNYNRRVILIAATLFFTLTLVSYLYISTLLMLVLVRMFHGASWATISTSNATIVPDLVPANKRGEGIGFFSMSMPLAMVIGPAIALEIFNQSDSFNLVFGIASAMGVLGLISTIFVKMPQREYCRRPLSLSPSALYEKRAVGASAMQFCYTFAWSGIATFLPIYAYKNGIDNCSIFFVLYAISVLLVRVFVRRTLDLRGPTPLIVAGYSAFAVGALLLAFTTTHFTFFISGIFVGVGSGLVLPSLNTMIMNIVEPAARGKANATLFTSIDIGMGLGAMVSGVIVNLTSYRTNYIISAIILLLPILFYFLYEKRHYLDILEKQRAVEHD